MRRKFLRADVLSWVDLRKRGILICFKSLKDLMNHLYPNTTITSRSIKLTSQWWGKTRVACQSVEPDRFLTTILSTCNILWCLQVKTTKKYGVLNVALALCLTTSYVKKETNTSTKESTPKHYSTTNVHCLYSNGYNILNKSLPPQQQLNNYCNLPNQSNLKV